MTSPAPATQAPRVPLLALVLLAVGTAGISAAWAAIAMLGGTQASWMAPLAALDAAWLLRLGGAPRGWTRAALALLGTVLAIAMANWSIVAAHLGSVMGLPFLDSAQRLGPNLAWTLLTLAHSTADLLWLASALVLAVVIGR